MNDFYVLVFKIFAVFLFIDLSFYLYIRREKTEQTANLNKEIKECAIAYVILMGVLTGWQFFFEDRTVFLECRQKTMTCSYFHTTEFNKKMRPAKTYDISRVQYARIAKHYRRRGTSFYTVQLAGEKHELDLPPHFSSSRAAKEEADKFNRFLHQKKETYTFSRIRSADSFGKTVLLLAGLIGIFLGIKVFWSLVEAAFKKLKNEGNDTSSPRKKKNKTSLDIDEEIRKDLKEEGMSDEEIEAFLKELNDETGAEFAGKETKSDHIQNDVIRRSKDL